MDEQIPIDFLVGALIWVTVGSVFWILRKVVLKLSIQVAEEDLKASNCQNDRSVSLEIAKKINILRALDAIVQTIFWVSFPFAMILLGMIIPAEVRSLFKRFLSIDTLIGAGLAAFFGYIAVFSIWKQHVEFNLIEIWRKGMRGGAVEGMGTNGRETPKSPSS